MIDQEQGKFGVFVQGNTWIHYGRGNSEGPGNYIRALCPEEDSARE